MVKKVYLVFSCKIKYFNILLTQESSDGAIDILKLRKEQRPIGKLKCERHLSVFNKRSEVANCINRTFAYKSIRNDVMLYRKLQNIVDLAMKRITKLLDERKKQWTDQSKEGL